MREIEELREASAALEEVRVLGALDAALATWRDATSPVRRRLRDEHPVFSAEVLDLGCRLGLRSWSRPALATLRWREVQEPCRIPAVTAVWLAGCIPNAAFAALLHPLLAGSAVYVKPSSADPISAELFRDSLLAADPLVGNAVRIGDDGAALEHADAVVVHGRDETVAALRARVPVDRVFVGHGHRLSIAAVGVQEAVETVARPLAMDVALYDGRGCLSPAYVLVVDRPAGRARTLASALAAELERLAEEIPRKTTQAGEETWVHERRAAAAMREGSELFTPGSSTAWTVILEPPETRPDPGFLRTVPLVPIPDVGGLAAWCNGLSPHLSSIGQQGWGAELGRLAGIAARAGGSRVCPLGRMQLPPIGWHHDGTGSLSALIRRVDVEGPEEEPA
jgi:hypothetical protein